MLLCWQLQPSSQTIQEGCNGYILVEPFVENLDNEEIICQCPPSFDPISSLACLAEHHKPKPWWQKMTLKFMHSQHHIPLRREEYPREKKTDGTRTTSACTVQAMYHICQMSHQEIKSSLGNWRFQQLKEYHWCEGMSCDYSDEECISSLGHVPQAMPKKIYPLPSHSTLSMRFFDMFHYGTVSQLTIQIKFANSYSLLEMLEHQPVPGDMMQNRHSPSITLRVLSERELDKKSVHMPC